MSSQAAEKERSDTSVPVRKETLRALQILKAVYGFKTYDQLIKTMIANIPEFIMTIEENDPGLAKKIVEGSLRR